MKMPYHLIVPGTPIAVRGRWASGWPRAVPVRLPPLAVCLDASSRPDEWRIGFFIGCVAGLVIIYLRRTIPASPRWLMTRGREEKAVLPARSVARWGSFKVYGEAAAAGLLVDLAAMPPVDPRTRRHDPCDNDRRLGMMSGGD